MTLVKTLFGGLLASVLPAAAGVNLIPDGDFSAAADKSRPAWCAVEGGSFSVCTEEATWNRCGRLVMPEKAFTNQNGHVTRMASVLLGRDGKQPGAAVKPDTAYELSLELKGATQPGVTVEYWNTAGKRGRIKLVPELSRIKLDPKSWSAYRTTFRTPADAVRAVIVLKLWESTLYPSTLMAKDAFALIDNVKLEESSANLTRTATDITVPVRKAIAPGETVSDFLYLRNGDTAPALTKVTLSETESALCVSAALDEPDRLVVPTDGCMWRGDTFEVYFGPAGERLVSQFAVGVSGERYVGFDGRAVKENAALFSSAVERGEKGWKAVLEIPYASLGLKGRPKAGETIAFNIIRHRACAGRPLDDFTWSKLGKETANPADYGTLVFGGYAAAYAAKYGKEAAPADRAAYEKAVQAAEVAALKAKFEKFKNRTFSAAAVPVTSDFAVPFLPKEIFDPPEAIALTAAVNERKSLPIAVANLTDRTEDYLVYIEHPLPANKDPGKFNDAIGRFGLEGFPKDRIRVRKALKFKDSDAKASPTVRLDPLPFADSASSLSVAPKEAGVMWFEFDTTDLKPDVYRGMVRVVPLCEWGKFEQKGGWNNVTYKGEMQTIPLTLEVRPIVLGKRPPRDMGFFMDALNEEGFALANELGASSYTMTPWSFTYEKDANGDFDYARPSEKCLEIMQSIRDHLAWGEKRGFRPRFLVCYSTVNAFRSLYNRKKDPAIDARSWPQFVKGMRHAMRTCGVKDDEWSYEAWDEPPNDMADDILKMLKMSKEAAPEVRIEMTLGHHRMTIDELARIAPYVDLWSPSDGSYWNGDAYTDFFLTEMAKGKPMAHYTCATSARESLDGYYRRRAWIGEKWGVTADLLYQYHDGQGPLGTRDFKVPTAGGIVFALHGHVLPSIRYMALREGVTDMKYFAKLKEIAGDDPKVKAFIADAVKRVTDTRKHDPAESERARETAAQMILSRQKGGAVSP